MQHKLKKNSWLSVMIDTPLTLHPQRGQQSIFDRSIWLSRHLVNYRPTVDQVSIEFWPSISQDGDQVSIDTWLQMAQEHVIRFFIFISPHFFLVLDSIERITSNTQDSISSHFQSKLFFIYLHLSPWCLEMWSNMIFHVWYIGESLLTSLFTLFSIACRE